MNILWKASHIIRKINAIIFRSIKKEYINIPLIFINRIQIS